MDSELRNKGIVPDNPATKQDKGKGKARETTKDERQPDTEDSIMTRIGKSATGLSRGILQGTPAASDLADIAASGKSGAPPSSSKDVAPDGRSSAVLSSSTSGTSVFRSEQVDADNSAGESAFADFLDDTQALVPAEPVGHVDRGWHEATHDTSGPKCYGHSTITAASSVAEQQEWDGNEVVQLLSQTDEEVPSNEEYMMVSETELKSLRRALFEHGLPDQLSATDWNNALNFIPDFLFRDSADDQTNEVVMDRYLNMGVTEPAEAGSIWLDQWNRVLTSYTDEVWGDLGDLVRKARTEVDQLKEGNSAGPRDAPAVRQLRAILTRVRARL